jgi:hypothetical protein
MVNVDYRKSSLEKKIKLNLYSFF